MASRRHLTVAQNLISGKYGRVKLLTETTDESELDASTLDIFNHGQPLGLSPGYADNGRLIALAIADDENCRIVEFQRTANKRDTLQAKVLCRDAGDVFAFNMGPLSMSLFSDLQLRISNAVDIQSAFSAVERNPLTAIRKIVGDSIQIFPENVEQLFREPIYDQKNRAQLAIRAWVSQFLATYENGQEVFDKVPRIDTGKFADEKLKWLAKLSIDALRLDNKKPTQVSHPVVLSPGTTKGVQLQSLSYDNKLRRNKDVRVSVTQGNINYSVHGSVGAILGKKSLLETGRELQEVTVAEVTSIGREDPTTAEAHRAATMLRILQGSQELFIENPWVQNIYLPPADGLMSWPEEWSKHIPTPSSSPPKAIAQLQQLNKSQQMAVNTMFSQLDENRVTLIQGPPGTGKTSVIAAFVQCSISLGRTGIWLVAKSNVAVKNIAEKLIKVGFYDWRLLVSKDFHFDWFVIISYPNCFY
ncbi:hypothetical protein AX17_002350 [Amanita inopinata Kibby_2008]|nr:hypothetical protein AX17_002350 [Amanita inopinata Kibby_2008]